MMSGAPNDAGRDMGLRGILPLTADLSYRDYGAYSAMTPLGCAAQPKKTGECAGSPRWICCVTLDEYGRRNGRSFAHRPAVYDRFGFRTRLSSPENTAIFATAGIFSQLWNRSNKSPASTCVPACTSTSATRAAFSA